MKLGRPATFWIAVCAAALVALVLLRGILLPFVVGILLAYLLVPAVDRLERFGVNRAVAALAVILPLIVGIVAIILVMFPVIIGEIRFFIEEFPVMSRACSPLRPKQAAPGCIASWGESAHRAIFRRYREDDGQ